VLRVYGSVIIGAWPLFHHIALKTERGSPKLQSNQSTLWCQNHRRYQDDIID